MVLDTTYWQSQVDSRPSLYSRTPVWGGANKLNEAGWIRTSCLLGSSCLLVAVDQVRCQSMMTGCVGDYVGPMVA